MTLWCRVGLKAAMATLQSADANKTTRSRGRRGGRENKVRVDGRCSRSEWMNDEPGNVAGERK